MVPAHIPQLFSASFSTPCSEYKVVDVVGGWGKVNGDRLTEVMNTHRIEGWQVLGVCSCGPAIFYIFFGKPQPGPSS